MKILWGALCFSHVILGGVLWFVRFGPSAAPFEGHPPPMFAPLFAVVAFAEAAVSFVLPKLQFKAAAEKLKLKGRPTEEQIFRLLPTAQTGMILGLALCESITLLGFVLGFLGAPPLHFLPFFAAGLLLALPRFPTENWLLAQLPNADTL